MPIDHRSTRAWRALVTVVVREEPRCWLRLPGCTGRSQTADHLHTVKARPDLAMERANLRGVCHSCNHRRNDTPVHELDALRARLGDQPADALGFFDV